MSLEFQNQRCHLQKVEFQKTLKFGSNVIIPSATPIGGEKQADPQLVSASKIQLPSTTADSPSVSVPMKFSRMVLDKSSGNLLEWPEWSGQFLATVDESGEAETVKMAYVKTLVTGGAKTALESMGYSGQTYHMA